MTSLVPRLNACRYLRATMTACSWQAGWRSILLRAYVDPPDVEELTTAPTADQLIVLVTAGSCAIEGRYGGRWDRARHQAGSLAMTAPGEEVTLRWRGETGHSTLQLHLPVETIRETMRAIAAGDASLPEMPNGLVGEDPLIQGTMLGLADAMAAGVPDLYAETAGTLLASHLLIRHCGYRTPRLPARDDLRMRRVDAFLRENLKAPLSLETMAAVACVSRFHFLRLFKRAYGETPLRRLTRLRMEEAWRRLVHEREPITQIAFTCGYENPAHFASAFRRTFGVSPSAYRQPTRSASAARRA
jgi:AraC family transcriptional regulator